MAIHCYISGNVLEVAQADSGLPAANEAAIPAHALVSID